MARQLDRTCQLWSTALAYPVRVTLLEELVEARIASTLELAEAAEVSTSVAQYHLDRLQLLRAVVACEPPRGSNVVQRYYCLTDRHATIRALDAIDDNVMLAVPDRSLRGDKGRRARELAQILRSARERQGIAVDDLARRAGLLPVALERIETGQVDPRVTVVLRLIDALGITPLEAMTGNLARTFPAAA